MKTMREHVETATKYSGASVGIGYTIAKIVVFFRPDIQPIESEIGALLTFVGNLVLVSIFKK